MADAEVPSWPAVQPTVPQKRIHEEVHAPNVPSLLNPDAAARTKSIKPSGREAREKKDSLKKREASGLPSVPGYEHSNKKQKLSCDNQATSPSPIRYNHSSPRETFHYVNKDLNWASHEPEMLFTPCGIELKKPLDQ